MKNTLKYLATFVQCCVLSEMNVIKKGETSLIVINKLDPTYVCTTLSQY